MIQFLKQLILKMDWTIISWIWITCTTVKAANRLIFLNIQKKKIFMHVFGYMMISYLMLKKKIQCISIQLNLILRAFQNFLRDYVNVE